jgi:hypothetical protein
MACLRKLGLYTATISSFGERHSAWHWYANFNEVQNCGMRGLETADVGRAARAGVDRAARGGRETGSCT